MTIPQQTRSYILGEAYRFRTLTGTAFRRNAPPALFPTNRMRSKRCWAGMSRAATSIARKGNPVRRLHFVPVHEPVACSRCGKVAFCGASRVRVARKASSGTRTLKVQLVARLVECGKVVHFGTLLQLICGQLAPSRQPIRTAPHRLELPLEARLEARSFIGLAPVDWCLKNWLRQSTAKR